MSEKAKHSVETVTEQMVSPVSHCLSPSLCLNICIKPYPHKPNSVHHWNLNTLDPDSKNSSNTGPMWRTERLVQNSFLLLSQKNQCLQNYTKVWKRFLIFLFCQFVSESSLVELKLIWLNLSEQKIIYIIGFLCCMKTASDDLWCLIQMLMFWTAGTCDFGWDVFRVFTGACSHRWLLLLRHPWWNLSRPAVSHLHPYKEIHIYVQSHYCVLCSLIIT